ncbi:MAG TPA: DUF3347 domain-containing protein [Cyclobacteriaceae bacterium]|nr:DUF3347 domain-containing protein [Cyclobacteriaceae bacterium]
MKTFMIALISLLSVGVYAQHDHANHGDKKTEQAPAKFKDEKLGTAYEHYIHLKDALVASNAQDAKEAALELQKSLTDVNGSKKVVDAAAKVAALSDLDAQRKAFSTLSNEMKSIVKDGKLASGSLYVEYCPMANDNEGAFWLSNEKQIKNPYFGDAMLRCGSVKETIQ